MICFRAITLQDTTFVKEETCNRIKLQLAWWHTPDSHAFLTPAITGNPMLRLSGSCARPRSEEHTSELQSHSDLVCRLLLEKKKTPHMNTLLLLRWYSAEGNETRGMREAYA